LARGTFTRRARVATNVHALVLPRAIGHGKHEQRRGNGGRQLVEPFGGSTVLVSSYPAMLANISPACLVDHATKDALSDWHAEIVHMVAAARRGDVWTPTRSPQQREDFLGKLAATILVDLAQTAMRHMHVGGETDAHASHARETDEDQVEAAGAAPAPETAPDDQRSAEHAPQVRSIHSGPCGDEAAPQ
jgi:hypothetical protein